MWNPPKTREEIIARTATDCNVSRDTVVQVIKQFDSTMRYFLTNPGLSGGRILVTGIFAYLFKDKYAYKSMLINTAILGETARMTELKDYFKDKTIILSNTDKLKVNGEINKRIRKLQLSGRWTEAGLLPLERVNSSRGKQESGDAEGDRDLHTELGEEGSSNQEI